MPTNVSAVKNKGIVIEKLPGDDVGLKIGLAVKTDFFGNPIVGLPDLGAVEMGAAPPSAEKSSPPGGITHKIRPNPPILIEIDVSSRINPKFLK